MDNHLYKILVTSVTLKRLSNSLPLYLSASDSSRNSLIIIRPGGLNAHCEIFLYLKTDTGNLLPLLPGIYLLPSDVNNIAQGVVALV